LKWQEFISDYLVFTRKDRIGILIVVGLILFALFLPDILSKTSGDRATKIDTAWMAAVKRSAIKVRDSPTGQYQKNDNDNAYAYQYDRRKSSYTDHAKPKGELFHFDPNTISTSDWRRLGLRDKTIRTIENFLNKGGHFYKPEDLQKIYGLHDDEYERLAPYIKIESKSSKTIEEFVLPKTKDETQPVKTYAARYAIIDVSTADTTALISLPGIGSKLAARIVTFREKLGGFYSIDQVGEVYGLADSIFQKIKQYLKLENPQVKKINVNSATAEEMRSHPYIKYSLANPIVAYRNEHGAFSKIEDVRKVMVITDQIYEKIAPYLTIQ